MAAHIVAGPAARHSGGEIAARQLVTSTTKLTNAASAATISSGRAMAFASPIAGAPPTTRVERASNSVAAAVRHAIAGTSAHARTASRARLVNGSSRGRAR